jgi:mannose/fructose/sorbose-specific phosphotransferase system IIA component
MVGLVVVAHGGLAASLLESAALIAGEPELAAAVNFGMEEGPDALREKVLAEVERLGGEVLLLVDLPGGTPSNVCARIAFERSLRVVSGVNLPMLVEVLLGREGETLEGAARVALEAGRDGVIDITDMISKQDRG